MPTRNVIIAEMSRNLHEGPARSATHIILSLDPARYRPLPAFHTLPSADRAELTRIIAPAVPHYIPMPRISYSLTPRTMLAFGTAHTKSAAAIASLARERQASLIYINSIVNLHAAAAARRARIPCVLMSREMLPVKKSNIAYTRWICSRAAVVIAVSAAVRSHLAYMGIPENSIRIIRNGLAPYSIDTEKRHAVRASLGCPDSSPLIGIVGTVSELKGHHVLFDAMQLILKKIPEARLAVIGEPQSDSLEYFAALKNSAQEKGIANRITYAGRRDDALDCIASLDLLAQPSVLDDSLPRTVLEAMSAGVPVTASRIGGIPEMVADNETGILFSPGNSTALAGAAIRILSDTAIRDSYSTAAVERVKTHFDPARQCGLLMQAFDDALAK